MRSKLIFFVALVINAITLLATVSSAFAMSEPACGSLQGGGMQDGLTEAGKLANWAIPAVLGLLMMVGVALRMRGRLLAANILLAIPALPMLAGVLLWGGLMVVLLVFG